MKDRVVVGMVGAQFAAEFHTRSHCKVSGIPVEIKGVTSKNIESARSYAKRYEVKTVYPSFEDMLADPEIDAVDLCVPNNLHAPMTVKAAHAGKHVICEKILTGY